MKIERNHLLDSIKGVTILLVVLGHCIQSGSGAEYLENKLFYDNALYLCIYSFHMPLFCLVSGYLMWPSINKRSFCEYSSKQLMSIGIPILTWGMIMYTYGLFNIQANGGGTFSIGGLFNCVMGSWWFLRILLICSILMSLIVKYIKNTKAQICFLIVVVLAGQFIPDVFKYNRAVWLLPYFCLGYYFYPFAKSWLQKKDSWITLLVTGGIFFLLFIGFKKEYVYSFSSHTTFLLQNGTALVDVASQLYINCYRWAIGLFGSVFVIMVCKYHLRNSKNVISYLGFYSLNIYIISGFLDYCLLFPLTVDCQYSILLLLIETIIMTAVTMGITWLVNRNIYINTILFGSHNSPKKELNETKYINSNLQG